MFGIIFIHSGSCELSWVPLKFELKSPFNFIWMASLYSLLKYIPRIKRHKTLQELIIKLFHTTGRLAVKSVTSKKLQNLFEDVIFP